MIHREIQGDIAVVRMAHGKVNALDIELLQQSVTNLKTCNRQIIRRWC